MSTITLVILFITLIVLILISAFFSAAETSMMAINRYRLQHLVMEKHRAALRVSKLLARSDRLLGVILLGNNFANILASAIATIIAMHLWGDIGVAIVTFVLTFIILILAEVAPKTLAASHSQKIAFLVSMPLWGLLKLLYPFVWVTNFLANGLLKLFRVPIKREAMEHLTSDELSTLVKEAGDKIPDTHQDMLLAILELEKMTVDDIMITRNDIVGIDIDEDWSLIHKQITSGQHTKLPVFQGDINNLKGVLHIRHALNLFAKNQLSKETIGDVLAEPYFIPEGVPLHQQLLNFRSVKARTGFVVDEYGDIQGLVTLEDILEVIVGEFTTDIPSIHKEVKKLKSGNFLVDAAINLRELNKQIDSNFNTSGPKTLSGLIIENLEMIPEAGVSLKIGNLILEVVSVKNNRIYKVKISKSAS